MDRVEPKYKSVALSQQYSVLHHNAAGVLLLGLGGVRIALMNSTELTDLGIEHLTLG